MGTGRGAPADLPHIAMDRQNKPPVPPAAREARLKAALKANLAKRKAQMRGRAAEQDPHDHDETVVPGSAGQHEKE
jgi:hypothetical protein